MKALLKLLFLSALLGASQAPKSQPIAAIDLRTQGSSTVVDIVNSSVKSIAGYVLEVTPKSVLLPAKGGFVHVVALRPGGKTGVIWPGSRFTDELRNAPMKTADNKPIEYSIRVDFVVFDDGSTWGPDTKSQGDRLAGTISGIKQERARLQRLLANKGESALINDLRKN